MILLMFDGAVNHNNFNNHRRLYRGRKNPNDCDILATYFLTHSYTDWSQVPPCTVSYQPVLMLEIFVSILGARMAL